MTITQREDGWWWPEYDEHCRSVVMRDVNEAVATVLRNVQARDLIIQAGGNVGVYTHALVKAGFRRVVTAEPTPENVKCLWRNLFEKLGDEYPRRVDARHAALGDISGDCRAVEVDENNCGANRVVPGGAVPMLTIDSLNVPACDAIWLDIEGYELQALKGAESTIADFSPVIVVEQKGLGRTYGYEDEAVADWLTARGYACVERVGNDQVWTKGNEQ